MALAIGHEYAWFSSTNLGNMNCNQNLTTSSNVSATFTCIGNVASKDPVHNMVVGWMAAAPMRGTALILWTCLFAIFSCTWTSLHVRIHKPQVFWRAHKYAQLLKTVFYPEGALMESLQEFHQACKLLQQTRECTNGEMKLIQAFYLGMLGVRYRTGQGNQSHRVLWPNQYAFLLDKDLVKWADHDDWGLSASRIADKDDSNGFCQGFTLLGVLWVVGQCISRWWWSLPVALLEVATLAYIFLTLLKYAFWWHKPKDVMTFDLVNLPEMSEGDLKCFESLAVEDTYDVDGPDTKWAGSSAFRLVGRDRGSKAIKVLEVAQTAQSGGPKGAGESASTEERQSKASTRGIPIVEQEAQKPARIIAKWDEDLYMSRKYWLAACLLVASFAALHLISWNYRFPTQVERLLWRGCAITSIVSSIGAMQFKSISFRWKGPVTILQLGFPLLFTICRVTLMVLVFTSFRAMPVEVYHVRAVW